MDCTDIREDLDLYALGTLEPAESTRVRAHAATCDACRARLLEAEHTAAALGRAVPRVRAPAWLKVRVLAAVRAEHSRQPAGAQIQTGWRGWPRRAISRYGVAAAALLLLPLGGLVAWAAILQSQVNELRQDTEQIQRRNDGALIMAVPSSVKTDFQPGEQARGATGAATWNPTRGVCFVFFEKLPQPEPGTAYRLWYTVDGGRRVIDAGTLTPDAHGRFDLIMDVSNWRGQEYDMVLRLESQPHDPTAPIVLTAKLRRPE
jgi:hypothetical protein